MDALIVQRKLDSLRRCLQRVKDKCPERAADLKADLDAQDILVVNLSRAVQLCVDLALHRLSASQSLPPDTMGEAFTRLAEDGVIDQALARQLRGAVGFRNLAVHAYAEIDWDIVHKLATDRLEVFKDFARVFAAPD